MKLRRFFQKLPLRIMNQFLPEGAGDTSFPGEWERLQEQMGYQFRDPSLLARALTHSSFANEQGDSILDYEQLEFLGDSVLDLSLGLELMRRFPSSPEGVLTQMRSSLVSEGMLARMARFIDLGACLRLGRGEAQTGGRERNSILADAYEALMAAVFLDAGFEKASRTILRLFRQPLEEVGKEDFHRDFKSEIQQWAQERFHETPQYILSDQWGPAHRRGFRVELHLRGKLLGVGTGSNKKEAEQEAARRALNMIQAGSPFGAPL